MRPVKKQLAARITEGINGVKEVRNDVTINYLAKPTDAQIAADIKARLQWDIWINGELIKPVVEDGKVTLTGTIGSAISKSRALDDAWVNGVTSVDANGLKIEPRASNSAHQKHELATRSDSEIKQAIQASLHLDPRVSAFSPDVTVEDGGVILGGNVGNLKAKTSAEQDTKTRLNRGSVHGFSSHELLAGMTPHPACGTSIWRAHQTGDLGPAADKAGGGVIAHVILMRTVAGAHRDVAGHDFGIGRDNVHRTEVAAMSANRAHDPGEHADTIRITPVGSWK